MADASLRLQHLCRHFTAVLTLPEKFGFYRYQAAEHPVPEHGTRDAKTVVNVGSWEDMLKESGR